MELVTVLTEAWKSAKQNIAKSQKYQKKFCDRMHKEPKYQIGSQVMVYMPHEDSGKLHKLALPYHGPYLVLSVLPSGISVQPVDLPAKPLTANRPSHSYNLRKKAPLDGK